MSYRDDWSSAFADVKAAGVSVTFTRTSAVAYDAATDRAGTPALSTIAGVAMKTKSNPQRFSALGLDLVTMPTLFFVPSVYGLHSETPEFVMPGDVVVWNGRGMTVKDVDAFAPNGVVIFARVVVAV